MKIVFVLLLLINGWREDTPVRVGIFEKYSQCLKAGESLKDFNPRTETKVINKYRCIAVNK